MSFDAFLTEHRRLSVLRVLRDAQAYTANDSLLTQALGHFGLASTRDQVRTELAWLRDQSLVAVDEIGGIMVATITLRGLDVASGQTTVPGVQRPAPRG